MGPSVRGQGADPSSFPNLTPSWQFFKNDSSSLGSVRHARKSPPAEPADSESSGDDQLTYGMPPPANYGSVRDTRRANTGSRGHRKVDGRFVDSRGDDRARPDPPRNREPRTQDSDGPLGLVDTLPQGATEAEALDRPSYYYDNTIYQPIFHGGRIRYKKKTPNIGSKLPSLPFDCPMISFDLKFYYDCQGTYYKKKKGEYVVVTPPFAR